MSAAAVTTRVEPGSSLRLVPERGLSVLRLGIVVLLFFGPLAFGAVEPWSTFIVESGTGLLFLLWTIQQMRRETLHVRPNPLYGPILAFSIVIILQLALKQTANQAATLSTALLYIAYGLLSFLTVQSLRQTNSLKSLGALVSAYGTSIAIFAMLQGLTPNGRLYWLRTPRFGGWIYGPYVNHNHYAGLMEMLFPVPLAVAFSARATRGNRFLGGLSAMIMASTILLSGSRGGMAALAAQLVLLGVLFYQRKRSTPRCAILALAALVVGLVVWVGGADLTTRLGTFPQETRLELSGGTRINIDRDTLRMFVKKPILGWGLGTFGDVYPQYRSFPTNLILDQAHNDYLQLLVETGTVGFLTMLWFLYLVYRTAIIRLRTRAESADATLAAVAIVGITGILIHGLVDFNLQIPANAAWFFVLCALATLKLTSPAQGTHNHGQPESSKTMGWQDSRVNAPLATTPR